MTNPPPVAPVVTDEMVAVAIGAYDHECEHFDTETQDALDMHTSAMRAAITAALEATGELERLRAALKPFADVAKVAHMGVNTRSHLSDSAIVHEWMDAGQSFQLTVGDFRKALVALQGDAP